MTSLNKYTS